VVAGSNPVSQTLSARPCQPDPVNPTLSTRLTERVSGPIRFLSRRRPHASSGVGPNALTSTAWRDAHAGTPWHKYVPARIEAVSENFAASMA
jgi:hypothetical protein